MSRKEDAHTHTKHTKTSSQVKDDNLRKYHSEVGSNLLVDYARREEEEKPGGDRVVCANADWLAVVPFWAVWPYETMVMPRRRRVARLAGLSQGERTALADIIKRLTTK